MTELEERKAFVEDFRQRYPDSRFSDDEVQNCSRHSPLAYAFDAWIDGRAPLHARIAELEKIITCLQQELNEWN